ncbi:MAG: ATPase, T2SS/T4P/T4SS family, partial [Stenotrophomonas sp.]
MSATGVLPPLPFAWARAQQLLLGSDGEQPVLVGTAATAPWAVAELRRRYGALRFEVIEEAAWQQRLGEQYRDGGDAAALVGAAESDVDLDRLMQDMPEVTDLLDAQDDAPVIRMINALLAQAARDGASDLHIEPFETHSVVRYRVDGTLRDMVQPRRALHAALVSRIKIMAHLDIAEKRL